MESKNEKKSDEHDLGNKSIDNSSTTNNQNNDSPEDFNDEGTIEGYNSSSPDKYLAMEQPGVTYTQDDDAPLLNSDQIEDGAGEGSDLWDNDSKNSRNSDAFNQDEYLLNDNIDLDEDQSTSISSENNDK